MGASSSLSLIGTGVALGAAHVLTGPDHLSALATLSANVGNYCQAFSLGVRWGIGHSTGLLLVGVILIVVSSSRDEDEVQVPHTVTIVFESLVGVFMLALGVFGVFRAWQKRPSQDVLSEDDSTVDEAPLTVQDEKMADHESTNENSSRRTCQDVEVNRVEIEMQPLDMDVSIKDSIVRFARNLSTKTVSVGIGLIHGLAGPGGVLGVIPAVQIRDWRLSSLYLGSFCLSSTLVMGCFAALYGSCSSRVGRYSQWEFRVECFSAALSILVGIMWIILLATGKLEEVFP